MQPLILNPALSALPVAGLSEARLDRGGGTGHRAPIRPAPGGAPNQQRKGMPSQIRLQGTFFGFAKLFSSGGLCRLNALRSPQTGGRDFQPQDTGKRESLAYARPRAWESHSRPYGETVARLVDGISRSEWVAYDCGTQSGIPTNAPVIPHISLTQPIQT